MPLEVSGGRTPLHSQRIGYVRVSSFDQNPERQLEPVQVDRLFSRQGFDARKFSCPCTKAAYKSTAGPKKISS